MSLINTIQDEQLKLRKSGQSQHAAFLATLLGDAKAVGKNSGNRETTDSEVIGVVKKFVKNVDETIDILSKTAAQNEDNLEKLRAERLLYLQFLPRQLAESELVSIISDFILDLQATSPKQMGTVLAALKAMYDGQYDGKLASAIVKAKLQ